MTFPIVAPQRLDRQHHRPRTTRALLLSSELDHHRRRRGHTTRTLATAMHMSAAMLNRVMTGRRVPTALEIGGLCALLDIPAHRRPILYTLAREAEHTQWTEHHPPWDLTRFTLLHALHNLAARITTHSHTTIPHALRTPAYHHALLTAHPAIPTATIPALMDDLTNHAAAATAVHHVHAHALNHPAIPPPTMRAQLRHLLASDTVRLIPPGTPPQVPCPFQAIHPPHAHPVVFLDLDLTTVILEQDAATPYLELSDHIRTTSLNSADTRDLIRAHLTATGHSDQPTDPVP
ncbi:Scr1 family TA system antitoxin-like transcriptional regulator [Actinokineospora spheciospongiae]|uniref:Scr1 family TA system antitoxin-like transcriptional regulator n=1 Tax=Actinokineospora spheciospongiae TaxID=909613 RepID=UPI000D9F395D|nr:Scr1 family TA system antitoxin-like transcriptional regulator [Actinokineospora spheciospongiae]PWW58401.1 helix-turn-helix protein [Actinokineospora spheciospongiae]